MEYNFRSDVKKSDIEAVREIVTSTGFFRDDEVPVAVELTEERFNQGRESGYEFIFMEIEGRQVAYSCFGLIPCSLLSYDLYWIVTHNDFRGKGLGSKLLKETEESIRNLGGKAIYVETSSKEKYLPTQKFYEKNKYELKARFEDFYDTGDDKLVYVKKI
ncbi:MAG: GNAT family N-acetyltransferase [Bacteroidetes bacterium]|nr:GNAT family N-acetyltransferase [Bacteroidota bacterium]